MTVGRPGGPYADRLLDPGGWPNVNEDQLYDSATNCVHKLQDLTFDAAEPWSHHRSETFDEGAWSGGAANAADGRAGAIAGEFTAQQNHLVDAATWYNHVGGMVTQAKNTITSNVHEAQRLIDEIEKSTDSTIDDNVRQTAIDNVVTTFHTLNVTVVAGTSAQVPNPEKWKSPPGALEQLLSQKSPLAETPATPLPTTEAPTQGMPAPQTFTNRGVSQQAPSGFTPQALPADSPEPTGGPTTRGGTQEETTGSTPPAPAPVQAEAPPISREGQQPTSGLSHQPSPWSSTPSPRVAQPPATTSPVAAPEGGVGGPTPGGSQPGPLTGTPAGPGGSPTSPLSSTTGTGSPSGPTTPQTGQGAQGPQGAQAPKPDSLSGATGPKPTGMQAPVQPPPAPLGNATPATPFTPPAAPIEQTATSSPTAPAATHPAVPSGNVAPPSAPSSGPASPTPPMPLGAPATPPPAAPVPPTAGPPVIPAATSSAQGGGAAAAPIPVSAARAERDLVAASAAAGALKRKTGGSDPLSVARRIAAALNAPDMSRPNDIGFFWLVALTADDTIVVANSYGIAYMPDGVNLPEQVKMVSADTAIPAAERARWATYPVAALTAWAQAHETTLRAVIGTTTHLEGIDPGAHKILLDDDDIPPSGKMTGRDRLQVSFPDAATKLAAVKDPDLIAQLPPAQADSTPPANETFTLWFDVMQPLMSAATGREIAHLNAFALFAAHSADLALYRAHNAAETADQRAAIADWLYWLHQYDLLTEAQADVTAKA